MNNNNNNNNNGNLWIFFINRTAIGYATKAFRKCYLKFKRI